MSVKDLISEPTASTLFLVHGLGLDLVAIRKFGFINAYLSDKDFDRLELSRPVFLLFQVGNKTDFNSFVDELWDRTTLSSEYDYEDDLNVLLFEFPEEFKEDYDKFLKGQYSKFSEKYKDLFPKLYYNKKKRQEEPSFQHSVFDKIDDWKKHWFDLIGVELEDDQEVWSSPSIETIEVLDIEAVKQKLKQ